MFVLFIALLHAVPILVVGFYKGTKSAVIKATIVMAVLALVLGGAKYGVIDLVGVAIGYYLSNKYFTGCFSYDEDNLVDNSIEQPQVEKPRNETNKKSSWLISDAVLIVLVVIVLSALFLRPHDSVRPINSNNQMPKKNQPIINTNKQSSDNLRHCLNLSSNEAVIKCTENKK